jgi:hypothetical protein
MEQEIGELRKLIKLMDKGKLTAEQLHSKIEIYSQVEKRAKLMLTAYSLALKNNKLFMRIIKSNMIGDMTAIDTGENFEVEKIQCLLEENIINRQECLDLSGNKKNYDICKECPHYEISRRLLLPDE